MMHGKILRQYVVDGLFYPINVQKYVLMIPRALMVHRVYLVVKSLIRQHRSVLFLPVLFYAVALNS